MDGFRLFILASQAVVAAAMAGLAIPLCRRKVPPNIGYGFRVRRTLEDPAVWYEANAHAGRSFLWAGVAIFVASALLFFAGPGDGPAYAWTCAGITLLAVGLAAARSFRFLRGLPR